MINWYKVFEVKLNQIDNPSKRISNIHLRYDTTIPPSIDKSNFCSHRHHQVQHFLPLNQLIQADV